MSQQTRLVLRIVLMFFMVGLMTYEELHPHWLLPNLAAVTFLVLAFGDVRALQQLRRTSNESGRSA